MRHAIFAAACLLLATACASEQTLLRPGVTDVFHQNPPTQVDILLVVDNSCSMFDEQQKLSEGFDSFVQFFDIADVDYHIGVVTTDMDDPAHQGRLVGSTKFITRETSQPGQAFRNNVRVGTDGSGSERGLEAAQAALHEPLRSGANNGFFRDDALLSIIFVSDEEDGSVGPTAAFINNFRDLKGQRRRDAFNASALIGVNPATNNPSDCGPADPNEGAVAAWRYWDVAMQSGGVVRSICEEDFTGIVEEMGLATSRLQDHFVLSRRPDPDSFEVTIFLSDETELRVPPEGVDGQYPWVYEHDGDEHIIRFTDLASLPPLGSRVVIRYDL